ncbi:MAG: hypothetical protein WCA35_30335 [Kovacikia sp.]
MIQSTLTMQQVKQKAMELGFHQVGVASSFCVEGTPDGNSDSDSFGSDREGTPLAIAPHLHNWVAGCDICQEVCPWNERFAQETDIPDFQPYPENLAPPLTELAQLSDPEWDRSVRGFLKPELN